MLRFGGGESGITMTGVALPPFFFFFFFGTGTGLRRGELTKTSSSSESESEAGAECLPMRLIDAAGR